MRVGLIRVKYRPYLSGTVPKIVKRHQGVRGQDGDLTGLTISTALSLQDL
jgi:hypothetical protein